MCLEKVLLIQQLYLPWQLNLAEASMERHLWSFLLCLSAGKRNYTFTPHCESLTLRISLKSLTVLLDASGMNTFPLTYSE